MQNAVYHQYVYAAFEKRQAASSTQKFKKPGVYSQFVEIPDDVVFTVEYSVRAAQMAVYKLLEIELEIPPITKFDKTLKVKMETVVKAFK